MNPPRDLLPGNADLADTAAQLSREGGGGSSWDVPLMAMATFVMVVGVLIVTPKMSQIYRELGVQLPNATLYVLQTWFHVAALAVLTVPCIWRYRAGKTSWAVSVWFFLALLYAGFTAVALFAPINAMLTNLGRQAG